MTPGMTGDGPPVDYAHTADAEQRRHAKATAVARLLYHDGLTASDVAALDRPGRAAAAAAADQRPPSDETWALVGDLVAAMEHWATQHPDDPRGHRRQPQHRARWVGITPPPTHSPPPGVADDTPLF